MSCKHPVKDKTTGRMRTCRKTRMTDWHDCQYCYTHWLKTYRKNHNNDTPPTIWTALGFACAPPLDTMCFANISALASLLRRGPKIPSNATTATDATIVNDTSKHGYIYVYTLTADEKHGDPWYKIGRTKHAPHQRLAQWPGSKLVKSWRVPPGTETFAESIIHRWLEYWRAYRFVLPAGKQKPGQHKRYLSVWYQPVRDDAHAKAHYTVVSDWVTHGARTGAYGVATWLPECAYTVIDNGHVTSFDTVFYPKSKSKERYTMEKEWFYCDLDYIASVVSDICKVVCNFEDRHRRLIQSGHHPRPHDRPM